MRKNESTTEHAFLLSLGRVVPAPHTQHLLGPFAAIAQNSSLRNLSEVDSVAHRQYYCGGSEELAIPETEALGSQDSSSEFLGVFESARSSGAQHTSRGVFEL